MSVWSEPLPLLHREVPPKSFMSIEPRSYPRQYSHLTGFKSSAAYIVPQDPHDHWNGKSSFPKLELFQQSTGASTTTVAESSKSHEDRESNRRAESRGLHYTGQSPVGRGYGNGFGPFDAYPPFPSRQQRKWSDDELENYFTQMRITSSTSSSSSSPRGREDPKDMMDHHRHSSPSTSTATLIRPVPIRPGDMYRLSPTPNSTNKSPPTDPDDSVSGESMATSSVNTFTSIPGSVSTNVPEKNKVILERIKRGLDHRTTIMVKNVPNKYTQVPSHPPCHPFSWTVSDISKCLWSMSISPIRGLMTSYTSASIFRINASTFLHPFAGEVEGCRGLILVLGMRLLISSTRFRLFLSPKPASERNGTPSRSLPSVCWAFCGVLMHPVGTYVDSRNRFHSDKICDISYANIQGKECLIEKFRNSCVMDEDPSYRPKIFHSSGPLMGQEQESGSPQNPHFLFLKFISMCYLHFSVVFIGTSVDWLHYLTIDFLNPIMRGGNYVPSHVLVRSVTFRSLSLPSTFSVRDTLPPAVALAPQSAEFTSRTLPARCLEKNRMLISYDIIFYIISFFCRHFSSGHTCDCISFFVVVLFVDTWTEPFSLLFVCEYTCHFLLSLSCHDCWC